MISLTLGTLRSEPFRLALSKLVTEPNLDTKTAYSVMRLSRALEQHTLDSQKEWVTMLSKYVESEGSKWKLNEEKTDFAYLDGVDKEAAKTAIIEFLGKKVEIDREKLDLTKLEPAKLTAADLSVLEGIISVPDEI